MPNYWTGVASEGLPATPGAVYYVNYGTGSDDVGTKANSIRRPWKTVDKAVDSVTTNKDDLIVLTGNSTHVLSEMLTVEKNRVHFLGFDGTSRRYGQNAKVSLTATTGATNIATIKNTGVRNSFSNIKFINESTVAQGLYCFVDGGEYLVMQDCEIYKSTDLDETGASELVINGDSAQFRRCTIGSLANLIVGTVIRANVRVTGAIAGAGKVMRDNTFEDCLLWRRSGSTSDRFVYAAADADVERLLLFKNTGFINAKNSTAVPAQAVATGASLTIGAIVLDTTCYGVNVTKMSTSTGVYVMGATPNSGAGIAVNAA